MLLIQVVIMPVQEHVVILVVEQWPLGINQ